MLKLYKIGIGKDIKYNGHMHGDIQSSMYEFKQKQKECAMACKKLDFLMSKTEATMIISLFNTGRFR